MKFAKDILIIDFEGVKHPVQVGAVLLDKETLEEKDRLVTYIYADLEGFVSPKSGITQEMINTAPTKAEAGKLLYDKFGSDIFIGSFVQNMDINHFQSLLSAANIDFIEGKTDFKKYDFHILDIWPIAYSYLLKNGYTGGTGSEEIFQAFGAKQRGLHDALEDCRLAAEILRKIIFE